VAMSVGSMELIKERRRRLRRRRERKLTGVVFDVGETLVDETRAWRHAAQQGRVPEFTMMGVVGGLAARGEDHCRAFELLGFAPPRLPDVTLEDFYPDAVPCLRRLRENGYAVGLAGNQPAHAREALADCGLDVDFISTSAGWGVEKPAPEFFLRVCEEAHRSAHELAYVGDRVDNDVLPAKRAGMFAVHVRRGPWGLLHDGTPADAQIDSLDELPGVFP
jgi:FMN phosphatase YigB (HAD superfamily)